jgi:hypothetical protein
MYGEEGQYAKEQAPITKTIGSGKYARLVVSKDGGTTWTDALTNKPVTNVPSGGGSTGGSTTKTSTETQATKDMTAQLSQLAGSDGFIAPDSYTEARNAWVQAGFNATTFDTKFKGYKNPNNPYYVTNKQ